MPNLGIAMMHGSLSMFISADLPPLEVEIIELVKMKLKTRSKNLKSVKKQPTMVAEDCCYIKEALKFTIPPARTAEEAVSPVGFATVLVSPTVLPKQVMHRWLSIDCCP